MKKYLNLLLVALFATMTLSLVSCKDDKDEPTSVSDLAGTWEMTKSTVVYRGKTEVDYPQNVYWVFTNDKLMVHDVRDLANGKEVSYSYNKATKELQIVGYPLYTVTKLTDTSLVMTAETLGMQTTNEFKKRQ